LGQGREFTVVDGRGFADQHACQDHTLSAKTRNADS
jgi:hypothetical protein